jgi:hypothetical protein
VALGVDQRPSRDVLWQSAPISGYTLRLMPRLIVGLCVLALCAACSEPPQKEIDRAQGAIDAARAAGAPEYASTEFAAAVTALNQAHEAVAQRDYRLALSHAINASERAQNAARQAADGKALARSQTEGAIQATATSLQQLSTVIKSAESRRVPEKTIALARATAQRVERDLQKARTLVAGERYLEAGETIVNGTKQIREQIEALSAAEKARPARPRR